MEFRRSAGWFFVVFGAVGIVFSAIVAVTALPGLGILLGIVAFPFVAALPLAMFVVGWRLTHPRAPSGEPIARRRVEPVPIVPDADAGALPLPITACPDCGFLGIRMPTIHDGLWPGGGETGARMACPRCDWQGLPVSFRTGEAYADFVRSLHADRAPEAVA